MSESLTCLKKRESVVAGRENDLFATRGRPLAALARLSLDSRRFYSTPCQNETKMTQFPHTKAPSFEQMIGTVDEISGNLY